MALLQAGTMRWKAAAIGGYHDGENALADQLQGALGPGQLSLADRGFFFDGPVAAVLRDRRPAAVAGQEQRPVRPVPAAHDPQGRVGARAAAGKREHARQAPPRRRGKSLPRLPDTIARLVCFTILTRTRRGRTKATAIRVLTTLLDPDAFPAREIAARYAERWQVETAFLHLKKTVRGTGRTLRGRSAALARQEAALLLVHNMIAALAARTAAAAGTGMAAVSFTAVLSLVRDHIAADTCCRTAESAPPTPGTRSPCSPPRSPPSR